LLVCFVCLFVLRSPRCSPSFEAEFVVPFFCSLSPCGRRRVRQTQCRKQELSISGCGLTLPEQTIQTHLLSPVTQLLLFAGELERARWPSGLCHFQGTILLGLPPPIGCCSLLPACTWGSFFSVSLSFLTSSKDINSLSSADDLPSCPPTLRGCVFARCS
jgi:hypothetical protein